jgi:hypothetical protein
LYHPFASAARAGAAETFGGVASYSKDRVFGEETLPALSVHVPLTDADAESGPLYVTLEQVAMPDVASVPENDQETAWLYQPPVSGVVRFGLPARFVGRVVSTLKAGERDALPPGPLTLQTACWSAPSALSVTEPVRP